MNSEINTIYKDRVRVRAVGVLVENNAILMVKHEGLGDEGCFWIPPGGGVETGDSLEETVTREFLEETGLEVIVKGFLFINEYINNGLHAIEIFFSVSRSGGQLVVGKDPEVTEANQIISDVRFLNIDELSMKGKHKVHPRFCNLNSINDLYGYKGVYDNKNIYLK